MLRRCVVLRCLSYVPVFAAQSRRPESNNEHTVTVNFRRTEAAVARAEEAAARRGFFYLPPMDYDVSRGIPPLLSAAQFDLVRRFFHADAIERLNTHTIGSELEGHSLDVVLHRTAFDATQAVIHSAAAEHFNYCFWYKSLRPWGTTVPPRLREGLQFQYSQNGSRDAVDEVQRRMLVAALSAQAWCGWVYLLWTGKVFDVVPFAHGTCPVGNDLTPLLALNLHESALHIDYSDERGGEARGVGNDQPPGASFTSDAMLERYVRNYFNTCNWNLAERYYLLATASTV